MVDNTVRLRRSVHSFSHIINSSNNDEEDVIQVHGDTNYHKNDDEKTRDTKEMVPDANASMDHGSDLVLNVNSFVKTAL